jgi:anti-anti-sigma factor
MRRRLEGTVEVDTSEGRCRLVLIGEFDVADSDAIIEGVRTALQDDAPVIELDLSQTTLLSSSAISALLQGASLADGQGRRLHMTAVSPSVGHALEVLDVARLFDASR